MKSILLEYPLISQKGLSSKITRLQTLALYQASFFFHGGKTLQLNLFAYVHFARAVWPQSSPFHTDYQLAIGQNKRKP